MSKIELYNCDCNEFMLGLPRNEYDLAIVDPPYGIGIDGQKKSLNKNPKHDRKEHKQKDWDNSIPSLIYFNELQRVSMNQIIWGANYFVKHLAEGHKGWIFWYKGQDNLTMSDGELAYSSFDCKTRIAIINRVELLKDGTIHPTQKPVKLYEWLLKNYAKEGDKIFDSHGGSMSIAIACIKMGFDLTLCELDKEYFDAGVSRVKAFTDQLNAFDEEPEIIIHRG